MNGLYKRVMRFFKERPVKLNTKKHLKKVITLSYVPDNFESIIPLVNGKIYFTFNSPNLDRIMRKSSMEYYFGVGEMDTIVNDVCKYYPIPIPFDKSITEWRFSVQTQINNDLIVYLRSPYLSKPNHHGPYHFLFSFDVQKKCWHLITGINDEGKYGKRLLDTKNRHWKEYIGNDLFERRNGQPIIWNSRGDLLRVEWDKIDEEFDAWSDEARPVDERVELFRRERRKSLGQHMTNIFFSLPGRSLGLYGYSEIGNENVKYYSIKWFDKLFRKQYGLNGVIFIKHACRFKIGNKWNLVLFIHFWNSGPVDTPNENMDLINRNNYPDKGFILVFEHLEKTE